jgi:hypothetical protein
MVSEDDGNFELQMRIGRSGSIRYCLLLVAPRVGPTSTLRLLFICASKL